MVFIGIFGLKSSEEKLKDVDFECTGCLTDKMELYAFRKVFQFFFIPVITLKKSHVIACNSCKSKYKLKEHKMEEILLKGKVKYDDVEEIIEEF
ncbi:MAG: zinc-ribbon domain-containing protein [Cetobacterium sp.]